MNKHVLRCNHEKLLANNVIPLHYVDVQLPFYVSCVKAGFPSPADDYIEGRLSLADLVKINTENVAGIYVVRAKGDSMINIGIRDNTYLIVDRGRIPNNNDIIIASIDAEFTVKRYKKLSNGNVMLIPENSLYKSIELTENFENIFWGVVTGFYQSLL